MKGRTNIGLACKKINSFMKKIVVVAVHPDDETLMCGGTLLKHKNDGDEIYWIIVTSITKEYGWDEKLIDTRQKEIMEVSDMYGFDKTYQLNFPTTRLDEIPRGDIIKSISDVFNEVKPDTIYLPNRSDVHSDHHVAFQAAYACTKNFRFPFIERVLMGETLSETEFSPAMNHNTFTPNVFVDISSFIDQKLEIMKVFASEVMNDPYPRSLSAMQALGHYRGSRIGKENAESFVLLFEQNL